MFKKLPKISSSPGSLQAKGDKKLKFALYLSGAVIITLGLSISLQSLLAAWTAPSASAPSGNVYPPINQGTVTQTIGGGLTIGSVVANGLSVTGNSIFNNNLTVTGNLNAASFSGNGSGLTNVSVSAVGGIDISRIVYGSNGYKTSSIGSLISPQSGSGFYESSSATDGPVGASWTHYLINQHSNSGAPNGYQMIIAQPYWEDNLYTRRVDSDNKRSWRKILDSGNIGSYADITADTIADDGIISSGETNFTNQALYTTSGPTFNDVYANSWFRNNGARVGLYSTTYATHLYWDSASYLDLSTNNGMRFRSTSAFDSALAGYVYHDVNGFGLLSSDGNWRVRTKPGYQELYGTTYFPGSGVWDSSGNVGIGTTGPGEKLEVNGNIKLSGASPTYKITNIVSPIASSDAATKGYVDALGSGFKIVKNSCGGVCITSIDCGMGWQIIQCGMSTAASRPTAESNALLGFYDNGYSCGFSSHGGQTLNIVNGSFNGGAAIIALCSKQ